MKVKELIEYLNTLPPNMIVILSSDEEGNSYRELGGFWEGFYTPEDLEMRENKLPGRKCKKAVCLW